MVEAWHTVGAENLGEGAEQWGWEPSSPWAGTELGISCGWAKRRAPGRLEALRQGLSTPGPYPVLSKKGKGAKDALRAYQRRAREAGARCPWACSWGDTGAPWKQLTPWWERKGEAGVCQGHAVERYPDSPPLGLQWQLGQQLRAWRGCRTWETSLLLSGRVQYRILGVCRGLLWLLRQLSPRTWRQLASQGMRWHCLPLTCKRHREICRGAGDGWEWRRGAGSDSGGSFHTHHSACVGCTT